VSFEIRFPPQPSAGSAHELVEVRVTSPKASGEERAGSPGRRKQLIRLHDYERIYALPGLYEEIVQRRLGCRTPARMARLLAGAAARFGWEPGDVRILDAGAGNGVSGEAFAELGMRPVVGLDILPAARDAALRDRPGVYGVYLAAELGALAPDEERLIRDAAPNTLACVGSIGGAHLPAGAVAAALELLAPDALVAYSFHPELGPNPLTGLLRDAEQLTRERAPHRRTVTGEKHYSEVVIVRVTRR
jgi:SAM-dependent methyltransferase